MKTHYEVFYDIIIEALDEAELANAIIDGRKDDFVSVEEIFSILDRNSL
ncbi:MAG: hypothetical protein HQK91_04185 [Nitrospirae bacterium]|nr:hypothetical protein [Nitrospirota bacterium]MBF0540634.1 hypothetical protein [Nitrospirota bacterium]